MCLNSNPLRLFWGLAPKRAKVAKRGLHSYKRILVKEEFEMEAIEEIFGDVPV